MPDALTPAPRITPSQATPPGLVALIFSILVGPVGLVLGVLSLVKARRAANPRPLLGFLATIIGAITTLLLIGLIVGFVLIAGSIDNAQRSDAMCKRAAVDPSLVSDLNALVAPVNTITAPYIPGSGPSADDEKALAARMMPLDERIEGVVHSDGRAYPAVFQSGYAVSNYLESAESVLNKGHSSGGSLTISAGHDLQVAVNNFSDALKQQCSGS